MNIRLLIIDADGPFRENLFQRLHRENYHILLTEHQTEAKQILVREDIDVVLLNLGGMSREGLTILKQIKTISPLTEAIIINSSKKIGLSIEGMKLGAFDDFLLPFDIDSLIARIRDAYMQKKESEKAKKYRGSDKNSGKLREPVNHKKTERY